MMFIESNVGSENQRKKPDEKYSRPVFFTPNAGFARRKEDGSIKSKNGQHRNDNEAAGRDQGEDR